MGTNKSEFDRDEIVGLGVAAATLGMVATLVVGDGTLETRPQFPLAQADVAALTQQVLGLNEACQKDQLTEAVDARSRFFAERGLQDHSSWYCTPVEDSGRVLTDDRTGFSDKNAEWTAVLKDGSLVFSAPHGYFGRQWEYVSPVNTGTPTLTQN